VTSARFPHVPEDKGHYESFYLRAVDPQRPRGAWIRYTTHQRPGRPATGSVWFTLFDIGAAEPYAVKQTFAAPAAPPDAWIGIGASAFAPGHAEGHAHARGLSASWHLDLGDAAPPLRHLPREWMYRAALPRTKLESPAPAATFDGVIEAGGERIEVRDWRGMAGHNWGAEHAARWIWLHGIAFSGAEDAWLDLSLGRVRIGPVLTPWIANGAVEIGGERIRVGGPRSAHVEATPAGCRVLVKGARVEAISRPGYSVAWPYADPAGGEHHSINCSIAELSVRVERPGREPVELSTAHGGAYELGTTDTVHGIPLQPFPDG
jgi:hypothetical protein